LSSDGTKIAFASLPQDIWVMNYNGTGRVDVTNSSENISNLFPVWSPDGNKIAFQRENSDNNFKDQIWVMDADGSNQRKLTDVSGLNWYPSWSPDGKKIAFISDRDNGMQEIYSMNVDGSDQTRLTNNIGVINSFRVITSLVWSP
jgi:Tol biopolymer transport system component